MVVIGAITIGQTPRDDVLPEIQAITGSQVEFRERARDSPRAVNPRTLLNCS
jgi:hypothetical protein